MNRIDRYLMREMFPPFLLNILFFTLIFLITQVLGIMDMVVNYRVGLSVVGRLLLYTTPFFLQFTVPLSVMITVLVTFFRLSADLEIIALKAGGYSLARLFRPVLLFCVIGFFLTAVMTVWGLPWGKRSFRGLVTEIATEYAEVALKPRVFNDRLDGITLYVSEIDRKNSEIRDVFIEDKRPDGFGTILAPKGRFAIDKENLTCRLRLESGVIRRSEPKTGRVHEIAFSTYELRLGFKEGSAKGVKKGPDKEEMSIPELRTHIASLPEGSPRFNAALMKLHEKLSIPFACLSLGLLAFPLGIRPLERRQASGIRTGLAYFLIYYVLLTTGWSLGETGVYPPMAAMWTPDLVMGGFGFWLFRRASMELPVHGNPLSGLLNKFRRRAA